MTEDVQAVEASVAGEVIVPPPVSATELAAARGVLIPCPGTTPGGCDSADLLTKVHASWVRTSLALVPEPQRTVNQENNLGCALALLGDWTAAKAAFRRAPSKNGSTEDRERARANEAMADRALS